jgi:hypothetical protein
MNENSRPARKVIAPMVIAPMVIGDSKVNVGRLPFLGGLLTWSQTRVTLASSPEQLVDVTLPGYWE